MKTGAIAILCFLIISTSLMMISRKVEPLPHRPIDVLTNWGQGRTPQTNRCPPGTMRFETDDGLFLECFRGTTR